MSDTDTPNQQQLNAFETASSDSIDSTTEQQTSSEATAKSDTEPQTSPLTELYETLNEAASNQLPPEAHALSIPRPLEPETRRHTTKDLPDSIPALPFEIGQWELAVAEPDQVIYATSGDAYDYRWGEGGGLYGIEVYLNNRGANRDGKYHRYAQTLVGFENGDQIQRKDVDSPDDLVSVRGFSPGDNDGDFGVSTGTQTRAETAEEAVIDLLLHLHQHPGAFGRYVDREPETDWTLHKLSPRSARWVADAPNTVDDDTLSLVVTESKLRIKSNDEDAPAHETTYYGLPEIASVPETLIAEKGRIHTFETVAAAITAGNELLSKPPTKALAAGQIP
jgi:hypothetical protein